MSVEEHEARTAAEVDQALEELVRATGAHIGAVYLLVPEDQVLRMVVVTGVSQNVARPWSRVALAAPVPVAEAARERRHVWVATHTELAHRFPRTALALPYHVALSVVPLTSGTTCWGAMLQLWPGTHAPELSRQEAQAIDEGRRRISSLLRLAAADGHPMPSTELRTVGPPPTRHEEPGAELTERFPEGTCALDLTGRITFLNRKAAELLGASRKDLLGARPWEVLPWLHDPIYENSYLAALFSRLPTSFIALRPTDSWLAFTLYPDATGISVRITPAEAPTEDHEPFLTPPTAAQARPGALFHLLHLSSALTEAVGVKDVAEAVTNQIMPVINVQGLAVLTADEGRLQVIGSRGFAQGVAEHFDGLPLSSEAASLRAIRTGIPMFYANTEELRRIYPHIDLYSDMAAFAYLPLFASGRTIGCCVLGYDQPHPFSPDERAGLTSLAGVIAQALERARLFDTENQIARGLQAALLPHDLPRIPGLEVAAHYLPATRGMDIGGDFYDLIRLDDTSAAAVIGDVQGHNVNAAALMGQVRTAVHAHASAGAPPDEVLARTNRLLIDLRSSLFTSCLYAHLDLRHNRARLAAAGHLPPVLCHADGHTEILDIPTGLLLGIEPEAEYQTVDVPLPPGAVLALYTDGLVEVPGTDLDMTIKELAAQLAEARPQPLDVLARTLVRHARRTRQSSRGSDDIALLLIKPEKRGD
ncbi:SpoIIE family protein phosphatase [Streptomyces sp. AK02-01A]|uniref:SpoIIE family protein phosphatase n=1 Tax=Streptomyces sp. AK02-01A TaxID=3028648 RepID=UPI0029AAD39E|nr:SpoIIE family protein phosphatase [Streptomyces sp. AK02-01A]MDX3853423.1 SpoIIE family protein phosphatase [Streptomyces sp. AK02-01A]